MFHAFPSENLSPAKQRIRGAGMPDQTGHGDWNLQQPSLCPGDIQSPHTQQAHTRGEWIFTLLLASLIEAGIFTFLYYCFTLKRIELYSSQTWIISDFSAIAVFSCSEVPQCACSKTTYISLYKFDLAVEWLWRGFINRACLECSYPKPQAGREFTYLV